MATPSSTDTDAPPSHAGPHYANAVSKPQKASDIKLDRERTQRLLWPVPFILLLCVVAMGFVLSLLARHP
jgi:hypothetical protein